MRRIVGEFEIAFRKLHVDSLAILEEYGFDSLFGPESISKPGVHLIRSAAMVEQCFGGLTTKLWDDPFEWTLPESLNKLDVVLDYFTEVESVREVGFETLRDDSDLTKELPAPTEIKTVAAVLLSAYAEAAAHLAVSKSILAADNKRI